MLTEGRTQQMFGSVSPPGKYFVTGVCVVLTGPRGGTFTWTRNAAPPETATERENTESFECYCNVPVHHIILV